MWALFHSAWPFREAFSSRNVTVAVALTLGLGVLVLLALIPAILEHSQDAVTLAVTLAYPLLDILLLTVAVPVFLLFISGTFWRPMVFVITGIIFLFSGDILFSLTVLNGTYYAGHPLELLFNWAFLALALGSYLRLKQQI